MRKHRDGVQWQVRLSEMISDQQDVTCKLQLASMK